MSNNTVGVIVTCFDVLHKNLQLKNCLCVSDASAFKIIHF